MALEVGNVLAKLGYRVDDSGADRYERRLDGLRREAKRDVVTDLKADVDHRGFQRYNSELDKTARESRKAESAAKSHGSVLGGLGKTAAFVAGPAAFAGLALGVKGAFDAYKESERVGRQTNAVIKSTGGEAGITAKQVGDLANAISRKTGVDDEAIQSGENLLLTFTNVRNETGRGNDIFNQATATITDMSAALGQDTKSSAIQLGKALNDPIKGITALSRVGVSFTKGQKDQIKGLVEHGKTLDAQKIILRELNKEFGGSAAATATSSKRLGVTLGNLAETVGRAVSPIFEKVAKGLDSFVNGALEGTGAGGKFVRILKEVGAAVGQVSGFIGRGFTLIRAAFGGGDADASRLGTSVRRTFNGISTTVRSAINSVVRNFRTLGPELETIARAVGRIAEFLLAIFRRMLPGIRAIWEGVARIIRGVVEVIAGILSGDFGKIAEGFKHILSGMVKAAGGIIRALTAPFRETMSRIGSAVSGGVDNVVGFFKRLPGRIASALAGLPGTLAGIGKRAVSAFGSALSGLPGAIGGALKGGGAFLGDIGRSIANWLNAHTPLGDKVKIGPLSVRLPALRRGGKAGNVGPGHGGPRLFIAGEGSADEWVISQEGDRRSNVAWAREALETLTGRRVGLHKGGKGATRKKAAPVKPIIGAGQAAHVRSGEAGIKNFERDIGRLERQYAQKDREYGLSEEEFVVENDDGTSSVDAVAVGVRARELGSLHALRAGIQSKYEDYKRAIVGKDGKGGLLATYRAAVARLTSAINASVKGKHKKERPGYLKTRQAYGARIAELKDLASDLDLDLEDQRLDLVELGNEKAGVLGTKAPAAPEAGGVTGDTGGDLPPIDTGTGDTGTGTEAGGAGATGPTPPTAEEIAAAAAAQISAFQSARADLFGSFGSNFAAAGGRGPFADETGLAAGVRYFGAADQGGALGAGAPTVTQIITFPTPPADPHGWTQASLHELQAAL